MTTISLKNQKYRNRLQNPERKMCTTSEGRGGVPASRVGGPAPGQSREGEDPALSRICTHFPLGQRPALRNGADWWLCCTQRPLGPLHSQEAGQAARTDRSVWAQVLPAFPTLPAMPSQPPPTQKCLPCEKEPVPLGFPWQGRTLGLPSPLGGLLGGLLCCLPPAPSVSGENPPRNGLIAP